MFRIHSPLIAVLSPLLSILLVITPTLNVLAESNDYQDVEVRDNHIVSSAGGSVSRDGTESVTATKQSSASKISGHLPIEMNRSGIQGGGLSVKNSHIEALDSDRSLAQFKASIIEQSGVLQGSEDVILKSSDSRKSIDNPSIMLLRIYQSAKSSIQMEEHQFGLLSENNEVIFKSSSLGFAGRNLMSISATEFDSLAQIDHEALADSMARYDQLLIHNEQSGEILLFDFRPASGNLTLQYQSLQTEDIGYSFALIPLESLESLDLVCDICHTVMGAATWLVLELACSLSPYGAAAIICIVSVKFPPLIPVCVSSATFVIAWGDVLGTIICHLTEDARDAVAESITSWFCTVTGSCPDEYPPVVFLHSPSSGDYYSGTLSITATVAGDASPIDFVEFDYSSNGGSTWSDVMGPGHTNGITTFEGEGSILFNTESVGIEHSTTMKVRVRAADTEGNVSEWVESEGTFTVDNRTEEPSSITVTANLNPATAAPGSIVQVSGTAYYDIGGPAYPATATVSVSGMTWTTPIQPNGSYIDTITAPGSEGTYSVSFVVSNGSISGSTSRQLVVDEGSQTSDCWVYEDAVTCRDVDQDHQPVDITSYFRSDDMKVSTWVQLTDVYLDESCKSDPVQVTCEYYRPDGSLHYSPITHTIPDPGDGYYWEWYNTAAHYSVAGYDMSDMEGKWTIKVFVSSRGSYRLVKILSFTLRYEFGSHLMAEDVQSSDPWDPINPKNTFCNTDDRALTWAQIYNVCEGLEVRWDFFEPTGDLYGSANFTITDPGINTPDVWWKIWGWTDILNAAAQNKTGDWRVDVFIQDAFGNWDLEYSDFFDIRECPGVNPSLSVSSNPATPLEGNVIALNVSASDNGYLENVTIHWNDGTPKNQSWSNIKENTFSNSVQIGSFPTPLAIPYYAVGEDADGNIGRSETQIVTVQDTDTDGPSITNLNIQESLGNGNGIIEDCENIYVSFNVSDPSGVDSVALVLDSIDIPLDGSYFVTLNPLDTGEHYITILALDADEPPAGTVVLDTIFVEPCGALPTLTWTGETGFESDGVNPDTGYSNTFFEYRITYTDTDGDEPASGFPRLHLREDGTPVPGSPFVLPAMDANPIESGRVYGRELDPANLGLTPHAAYTYQFEAIDLNTDTATGDAAIETSGPVILRMPMTIWVDDDNTGGPWDGTLSNPYQSIQAGVDAALDGDTVQVSAGTYNENVVCAKSLVLIGESNSTTIIDGGGTTDCLRLRHPTRGYGSVSGFAFTNPEIHGIRVYDTEGGYWHIFSNRFFGNPHNGIWVAYDSCLIERNVFYDNVGGIYAADQSFVQVYNNTFVNNNIGVFRNPGSHFIDVQNNIIAGNVSGIGGNEVNYFIDYNDLWDNTSDYIYNTNPGEHDISLDPQFVNESQDDFHLACSSPCIDAGNPSFAADPDGSVLDMGAFAIDQRIECNDNLIVSPNNLNFVAILSGPNPPNEALSVASDGGVMQFSLTNNSLWLETSIDSGMTGQSVDVHVDASGLDTGLYLDTIHAVSYAAANSPQVVTCSLMVIQITSTTIWVDDDNTDGPWDGTQSHPYQTIQDGVDASQDSDTIMVFPGTYNERFMIFGKSPAIISTSGPDSTFLTADVDRRVITISDCPDTVSIIGFDISGGVSLGDTLGDWGAGILTYNTNLKIDSCKIHDNIDDTAYTLYDGGGGIFAYNSYLSVENCEIYNNSAAYSAGGGIYFKAGSYGSIKHNYIHDNFGSFGGGIMASTGATGGDIEFNVICNNTSSNDGGGIYLYDTAYTGTTYNITNNTITNNIAAYSGTGINGVMVGVNGVQNVVAYNCVFEPDQAENAGNVCMFECGSIIWNCNDVYSDISPDYCNVPLYCGIETIPDGNITENPLFCEKSCGMENLHLSANSPCAADNPLNPCGGLIGALPVDSSCGAILDYIVIEGMNEIPESTSVQYQCHAYYTDYSDRYIDYCDVTWSHDCQPYGEIDNCGEFTTFDVSDTVSCQIFAEYTEGDITRDTVLDITIYPLDCCIDVAEVAGATGMPVGVPVLAKCEIPGVAGVEFHADYDASVIQCDSIVSDIFDDPTPNCETEALHFIWDDFIDTVDLHASETIMVLWFTCVGEVGDTGWIYCQNNIEFADSDGEPIPNIFCCDGFVYIPPCNDISGNIVYYDSIKAIPDVGVELYGNQSGLDSTDTCGDYHFECLDPDDYTTLPSRISDDPGVSVSDIIKIRRLLAHIEPFDNLYKCIAADVNCDCRISVADVIKLRRYLAHIEDIECGNWKFVDADFNLACDGFCTDFDDYCPFPESIFVSISGQDILDANFIGIRIGDVNNTWSSTSIAKLSNAVSKTLKIENAYINQGDIVKLPVTMSENTSIAGIEMHIKYDSDQMKFLGIQSELPGDITVGSNNESIHIVWEDINRTVKTSYEEPLLILKFEVEDNFESETPVNITGAEIVDDEGRPFNLEFHRGVVSRYDFESEGSLTPKGYCLEQNRPNPFNPITEIRFGLPEQCEVSLEIFNIMGQKVKTLVVSHLDAGFHSYSWDATGYSSGIYFTRLKAGVFTDTKKMILLK